MQRAGVMQSSVLTLAFAFLSLVAMCNASFTSRTYRSHVDVSVADSNVFTDPPSLSPWDPQPDTGNDAEDDKQSSSSTSPSSRWGTSDGIDFLVAAFFLVAAGWLVLALIYSILVLIVVRLRARGQLDVFDEEFGRFYLLGSRCYIPFGCILRRYVIAMNQERNRNGESVTIRLMTREERRMAMERLLDQGNDCSKHDESTDKAENKDDPALASSREYEDEKTSQNDQSVVENTEEVCVTDDVSEEEPVCTICLNEYEPNDECFTSSVCSHQFHRTCILEWLQRRANTECPCCRTPLVTDEQVWETVQGIREEHRRQIRKANRGGFFSRFRRGHSSTQDDDTVDPTPPPSPSPTALRSFGTGDETQGDDLAQYNTVAENVEGEGPSQDLEVGRRLYAE